MSTPEAHAAALRALLPRGRAIPSSADSVFRALLLAYGDGLSRVHQRALELLDELDPRTTVELIEEHERAVGLPDPCTGPAETLQERRNRVIQVLVRPGLQNIAFYQALAESLGYEVTIEEHIPMEDDHFWRVTVTEPRVTLFRCGSSRCTEKLRKIDRAEDLECLLNRLKPAHTDVEVSYVGV